MTIYQMSTLKKQILKMENELRRDLAVKLEFSNTDPKKAEIEIDCAAESGEDDLKDHLEDLETCLEDFEAHFKDVKAHFNYLAAHLKGSYSGYHCRYQESKAQLKGLKVILKDLKTHLNNSKALLKNLIHGVNAKECEDPESESLETGLHEGLHSDVEGLLDEEKLFDNEKVLDTNEGLHENEDGLHRDAGHGESIEESKIDLDKILSNEGGHDESTADSIDSKYILKGIICPRNRAFEETQIRMNSNLSKGDPEETNKMESQLQVLNVKVENELGEDSEELEVSNKNLGGIVIFKRTSDESEALDMLNGDLEELESSNKDSAEFEASDEDSEQFEASNKYSAEFEASDKDSAEFEASDKDSEESDALKTDSDSADLKASSIDLYEPSPKKKKPEKPAACDKCGKMFSNLEKLSKHVKLHFMTKDFKCDKCEKAYKTKHGLNQHMLNHGDTKNYSCEQCDKKFYNHHQRYNHVYSQHSGDKRICICDECGLTLRTSKDLKRHKAGHTGARPYVCKVCDKAFKQIGNLKAHSAIHADTLPFVCSTCGKGFTQKYNLTIHERIHNGALPFPCPRCKKGYRVKCSMLAHLKKCQIAL